MKKALYSLIVLPLALAACTPTPPVDSTPKLPALASALSLSTANLNEFPASGCNTDATDGLFGVNNKLVKFCVAADADFVYFGSSYTVDDNSVIHYIALDNGGPARDMNLLDAWARMVKFDVSAPAPSYFLANYAQNLDPQLRKIESATAEKVTTSVVPLTAENIKVNVDGKNVVLKAKVAKSALGSFTKISLGVALVGGDNYGAGTILPKMDNTIGTDTEKRAVTFKKLLTFTK